MNTFEDNNNNPNNSNSTNTQNQSNNSQIEVDANTISPKQISQLTDTSLLAQPYSAPILKASFKNSPSDFQVNEILNLELSGEGEHLWLFIKKTNMNTVFVAQQLSKWAKIPSRDVGYSGMKDRHAVTTQWFSLRIPKKELPDSDFKEFIKSSLPNKNQAENMVQQDRYIEDIDVLKQDWHSKKLNRGTHKANQFVITLRDIELNPDNVMTSNTLTSELADSNNNSLVDKVLTTISQQGVPNYFGSQRFGRQGNNIASAIEWFEEGTISGRKPHPKKSRDIQSLLLSAARSALFNQILNQRVTQHNWNTGLDGDVFNLEGSGSVFTSDLIDDELTQRLVSGDIHPTAPLWGINNDKVNGVAKALEEEVIKNNPILQRLAQGLEQKQLKTMRRALRLPVENLDWKWMDDRTLVLDFRLPTGTFATSVLANLVSQLDSK